MAKLILVFNILSIGSGVAFAIFAVEKAYGWRKRRPWRKSHDENVHEDMNQQQYYSMYSSDMAAGKMKTLMTRWGIHDRALFQAEVEEIFALKMNSISQI